MVERTVMFNRVPCSEISFRILEVNFMKGNPAKVWESLNSPFEKKTRSFRDSFFRCSMLNFDKRHSHLTRGGRAQEWQGPFRMVRWLHVWGMWLGAVAAYRMAWEFGSMRDVHKLYRLQWSACSAEACSKPWLHFQDDIFWVSPVSLFWDLTRMAFHNVAGRVCWQWHQRLWRLQMGAGRRVRVNHHFPRSWCVRHPPYIYILILYVSFGWISSEKSKWKISKDRVPLGLEVPFFYSLTFFFYFIHSISAKSMDCSRDGQIETSHPYWPSRLLSAVQW